MYLKTGIKQHIKHIDKADGKLTLADSSRWEVSMLDKIKVALWLIFDEVIVTAKGLDFQIENVTRKETVEVKHMPNRVFR